MPLQTLVKYCNPIRSEDHKVSTETLTNNDILLNNDILQSIIPPRTWSKDGITWIQYISSTPATPSDIERLKENLNKAVKHPDVKELGGICKARHDIYASAFDEVIRQVTISCAERGLLLLQIREEIKLTLKSYQQLIESSFAFGIRKSLLTHIKHNELKIRLNRLKEENDQLKREQDTYRNHVMNAQNDVSISYDEFESRLNQLQKTNLSLKTRLRSVISSHS